MLGPSQHCRAISDAAGVSSCSSINTWHLFSNSPFVFLTKIISVFCQPKKEPHNGEMFQALQGFVMNHFLLLCDICVFGV